MIALRNVRRASGLLLALAVAVAVALPAVAVGDFAGYNRADVSSWSPKHNVSSGTRTKVRIRFVDDDGVNSHRTVTFWADRKTKFYRSRNTSFSDPESSYKRVSRNTFFKSVNSSCNCNVASNVTWKWRRDSHGKRYRYLTRLRITKALAG